MFQSRKGKAGKKGEARVSRRSWQQQALVNAATCAPRVGVASDQRRREEKQSTRKERRGGAGEEGGRWKERRMREHKKAWSHCTAAGCLGNGGGAALLQQAMGIRERGLGGHKDGVGATLLQAITSLRTGLRWSQWAGGARKSD